MKVHENAEVVKVNLDRRAFTKHGQHMNAMGKELMAKRITEAIKHTLKACKKTPVFMKWKEDTNKDKQDTGKATIGIMEGRGATEKQNDSVQAEESNSRLKLVQSNWTEHLINHVFWLFIDLQEVILQISLND